MTAQIWIDETRDLLLTDYVEETCELAGAVSDTSTQTVSLVTPGASPASVVAGVVPGATIEVGTELMYVYSVTDAGLAYVSRGYRGSTAATHSSGAVVTVNPKIPAYRILKALNDDMADLSSPQNGLFQVATVEVTFDAAVDGYNLTDVTADILEIHEVTYTDPGSEKSEPKVDSWSLRRNRDTADFASGYALVLHDEAYPGNPVRVTYKAGFTSLASASAALSTTGLHAEAYDLPPLGAALKLMSTRPIRREFIDEQGSSRRAEEVPSGGVSASMRDLRAQRASRLNAEATRLDAKYPTFWMRSRGGGIGRGV